MSLWISGFPCNASPPIAIGFHKPNVCVDAQPQMPISQDFPLWV